MTNAALAQNTFKDRTTGLILFGLFEIFAGLLCLLGLASIVFLSTMADSFPEGASAPSAPAFTAGMLAGTVFIYGGLASVLIALGVGSMLCRRWARTLSLLMGWMALIGGCFGIVAMIMLWPQMEENMRTATGGGPEIPSAVMLLPLAFVGLLVIVVPGALVLFYRGANVRATCEWKDPKPRWTDSRPLPILALLLMLAWGVVTPLSLPLSGGLFMVFGVILKGVTALLAALAFAAISAWCAWRIWYLDIRGWWTALVFWGVLALGSLGAFDPDKQLLLYEEMGMPAEQIELIAEQALPIEAMVPVVAVGFLAWLAFFLYCKRYFAPPATA